MKYTNLFFSFFVCFIFAILLLVFPSNTSAQSFLFSDDFNDNNIHDGSPLNWDEIPNDGTWSVESGQYVGKSLIGDKGPISLIGSNTYGDYQIEVDISSISGVDRHILFRYDPERTQPGYAVKYRDAEQGFPGHIELQRIGLSVVAVNDNFKSHLNETHKLKIEAVGNRIKIFTDNTLQIDYTDDNPIYTGKIGFFVERSGVGIQNITAYDNFTVKLLTNSQNSSVPLIKQGSLPWGPLEYDTASKWAGNDKKTIERWGCALTSASMILNYYNHPINPGELNTWLLSQPDGYLSNGLLNWLAITRYAKLTSNSSALRLEYTRYNFNSQILANELDSQRPAILKLQNSTNLATHFVVAKAKTSNDFEINDPGFEKTLLSQYPQDQYNAINAFTPSNTDLSYMLFTTSPQFDLKVKDNSGNEVSGQSFTEGPILDALTSLPAPTNPLKLFIYPKPGSGTYTLELKGNKGTYKIDSYLYNTGGDVIKNNYDGIIGQNEIDSFSIGIGATSKITQKITIDSTLADLKNLYDQKFLDIFPHRLLKEELFIAKGLLIRGRTQAYRSALKTILFTIKQINPKHIKQEARQILQNDINNLLGN